MGHICGLKGKKYVQTHFWRKLRCVLQVFCVCAHLVTCVHGHSLEQGWATSPVGRPDMGKWSPWWAGLLNQYLNRIFFHLLAWPMPDAYGPVQGIKSINRI